MRLNTLERESRYPCAGCDACCTVIGVGELAKPLACRCPHANGNGCSIYSTRPRECRTWACLWSQGHLGDRPDRRPDKCGLLVTEGSPLDDGKVVLEVWETRPGALEGRGIEMARYWWRKVMLKNPNYDWADYIVGYPCGAQPWTVDGEGCPQFREVAPGFLIYSGDAAVAEGQDHPRETSPSQPEGGPAGPGFVSGVALGAAARAGTREETPGTVLGAH
jgi:hypothetical protein